MKERKLSTYLLIVAVIAMVASYFLCKHEASQPEDPEEEIIDDDQPEVKRTNRRKKPETAGTEVITDTDKAPDENTGQ